MSAEVSANPVGKGCGEGRRSCSMPFPPNFCLLRHRPPPSPPTPDLFWSRASPSIIHTGPKGSSQPFLSSPFSRLFQGLPGLHGGRARPL